MQTIKLHVTENAHDAQLQTEQARVIEAVSPTIDVSRVEGGAQITVEDYRAVPETVTLYDGADGAPGVDGKDGKDGADGYSPVRGVDYWTAADEAAIVAAAVAAVLEVYPAAEGVSF